MNASKRSDVVARAAAGVLVGLLVLAAEVIGQRVQFPTSTAPPSTFTAPPPTTSPFAAPPVSPPLFPSAPPPAPAQFGAPVTTPIPAAPAVAPPAYPVAPPPAAAVPPYPSTTAPLASPAPFTAAPATPAPALGAPITPVPGVSPPPPTFDPYSTGAPAGPPPAALPYSYTPPPAPPATPTPLVPSGQPYPGVQPFPTDEGYYAKAQRLLQEISYEQSFLYGKHSSPFELEINRTELSATFAMPLSYNLDSPLLITPGFAFNWLDGPESDPTAVPRGPDLPPRVYDAYLDFAWYPKFTPWLGAELGFRTGVWSDFDHVTDDSVRLLGRGLASFSVNPTLDLLVGVVYIDRLDIKILPAGGVYWRPTPEWDAYLVFPNPKVRKYWSTIGNSKWYWYVAGEYGGGTWTANRAGFNDQFDINDIRVLGGLEWETQTQIRGHLEMGYVFDRQLVFRSGQPGEFDLSDTFMFRGGIEF